MKRGYVCQCGWKLSRLGVRTKYAEEKRLHAMQCDKLAEELKRTQRKD